jgi:hypothetical protein
MNVLVTPIYHPPQLTHISGLTIQDQYTHQPALNWYRTIPENGILGLVPRDHDVVTRSLVTLTAKEPLKEEGEKTTNIVLDSFGQSGSSGTSQTGGGLNFREVIDTLVNNKALQNSAKKISKAGLQNLTNAITTRIAPPPTTTPAAQAPNARSRLTNQPSYIPSTEPLGGSLQLHRRY